MFSIAAIFVKFALLVYYFKLFGSSKSAKIMIWVGIVTISLFYVASMAADIYLCYPHKDDGGWFSLKSHNRCGKASVTLSATQRTFNAVSDIYVLYIPLRLVWDLPLPTRRKVCVSCVFVTGLL